MRVLENSRFVVLPGFAMDADTPIRNYLQKIWHSGFLAIQRRR